ESLRFLDINQAAIDHYGWTREEFLRMTIRDIRPPEELPTYDERTRRRIAGLLLGGRTRHWRKDGSRIEVETSSQEVLYGGMRARLVLATDVTGRVRMEEDVQRFVSLVENAGDFIAMVSPDSRLLYLNKAGRDLVGLADDSPVADLSLGSLWHEDSRETVQHEVLPRLAAGESWGFDGRLRPARAGEPGGGGGNGFPIPATQTR